MTLTTFLHFCYYCISLLLWISLQPCQAWKAYNVAYDAVDDAFLIAGADDQGATAQCVVTTVDHRRRSHLRTLTEPQVCTSVVILNGTSLAAVLGYHPTILQDGSISKIQEQVVPVEQWGDPSESPLTPLTASMSHTLVYPLATIVADSSLFVVAQVSSRFPQGYDTFADSLSMMTELESQVTGGYDYSRAIWTPAIHKWDITTGNLTWEVPITTSDRHAMVSSIAHVNSRNVVLVAGSSIGQGAQEDSQYDNWDGFLLKLDPTSGALLVTNSTTIQHSTRIQTQQGKDDFIAAICVDDHNVYVVGSTQGIVEGIHAGGAFVLKLDIDSFQIVWRKQFSGDSVQTVACALHEDVLYLAGNVPSVITQLEPGKKTKGEGLDWFVAQVATQDATTIWIKQSFSYSDDRVQSFVVDKSGNAIVLGNAMDRTTKAPTPFLYSLRRADGEILHLYSFGSSGDTKRPALIAAAVIVPLLIIVTVVGCLRRRANQKEHDGPATTSEPTSMDEPGSTESTSEAQIV